MFRRHLRPPRADAKRKAGSVAGLSGICVLMPRSTLVVSRFGAVFAHLEVVFDFLDALDLAGQLEHRVEFLLAVHMAVEGDGALGDVQLIVAQVQPSTVGA